MTEGQVNLTPSLVFAEEIYNWKPNFKIIDCCKMAASRLILKNWKTYLNYLSPYFHFYQTTFIYLYMHDIFYLYIFWFMFIEFLITSIHTKAEFIATGTSLYVRYEANSSFLYLKTNFGWEINN